MFLNLNLWFDVNIDLYTLLTTNPIQQSPLINTTLEALNNSDQDAITDNLTSLYHFSIPNTKLYYPEPFISSATFLHYDLWFVHISIYQYWLWFFFIFMIIFFTLTFLTTLRWCNIRLKPQRETRGVSRSKCGDLITAAVPVTWAGSIIIHESSDAIEYYDGFGTTEMAVGVRAYQWGWEYYYPKDIDLNYKIKNSGNFLSGNSVAYNNSSSEFSSSYNFWNYYKNKDFFDGSITPAHLIIASTGKDDILNFWTIKNFGFPKTIIRNAFKNVVNTRYISYSDTLNYSLFSKSQSTGTIANKFNFSTENNIFNMPILHKTQTQYLSNSSLFNFSKNYSNLSSLNKFLNNNIDLQTSEESFLNDKVVNYLLIWNNFFYKKTTSFLLNSLFNNYNNSIFVNKESDSIDIKLDNQFFFSNNFFKNKLASAVSSGSLNFDFDKNYKYLLTNLKTFKNNHLSTVEVLKKPTQVDKKYQSLKNSTQLSQQAATFLREGSINSVKGTLGSVKTINSGSALRDLIYNSDLKWRNLHLMSLTSNSQTLSLEHSAPFLTTSSKHTPSNLNVNQDIDNTNEFLSVGEVHPSFLSQYITKFTTNFGRGIRFSKISDYNTKLAANKWPSSYMYADLDFKRVASHELLEDIFWEASVSGYLVDKYKDFKANSMVETSWNYLYRGNFGVEDRGLNYKYNTKVTPFFKSFNTLSVSNPLELKVNKGVINYAYLVRKDLAFFSTYEKFNDFFDNSFIIFKESFKIFNSFNTNILLIKANKLNPVSDLLLLNSFWSDFEPVTITSNLQKSNRPPITNSWNSGERATAAFKTPFFQIVCKNAGITTNLDLQNREKLELWGAALRVRTPNSILLTRFNVLNSVIFLKTEHFLKFNADNSLLDTFKNVIISENAIWKIYRSSFDEGRSHTNFKNFSSSYSALPVITEPAPNFKRLLHKNTSNFVTPNIYVDKYVTPVNDLYFMSNSLNFFTYEFPFFTSIENDSIRYSWFDWYSNNNRRVTKALDTTQYNLNGSRVSNNKFDFLPGNVDDINSAEGYLTKLSHARKIYLPSWTYSLFLLSKLKYWYSENSLIGVVSTLNTYNLNTASRLYFLLNYMNWYENSISVYPLNNYLFINGYSSILTPARNYWRSTNSYSAYSYYTASLLDILFKKEYLLRQLLSTNRTYVNLPTTFVATPSNPLLVDLKSSLIYNTQIENTTENYKLKSLLFLNKINYTYFTLTNNRFTNYITNYFFKTNTTVSDVFFKKSQYKHMRKSMSNMIRIQADKAVAMPVDTRIQLLTVSKDIIHSWSIPSAGIKVDCIPGYSSHKVTIFLLSGIYWGQCMEICGRFHHWMPIVVYFMKRDLFILWCVHFIFYNNQLNGLEQHSDKMSSDFLPVVSFNNSAWLLELK